MYLIMIPRAEFPLWASLQAALGRAQGKACFVSREERKLEKGEEERAEREGGRKKG